MRRIKPLPEGVRSSVRSGVILYDLTRVVEELVFNSLDAGATKVSVAVGVATCFVKVADNGSGVDRDGLVMLGERYATSKHGHLADLGTGLGSFGLHGEALCSISDVSVLEIISKAHGMPHGYRKVMKNCKCLYLGISDDRHDVGTTVIVRDLFYNQPVRRKQMQSSPKKVLHLAKKCVLRIALVHSRVSFKVFDIESQEELLGTCSSQSPLSLLSTNFGIESTSSLYELEASKGELKLSGYLSGPFGILYPKAFQYIYINSRFICKGRLHKLLNQLAAVYLDNKTHYSRSQIEKPSGSLTCPTFILNLSCPSSHYDIVSEPLKSSVEFTDWGPVLEFIQDAVIHFWGENVSEEYCESRRKKSRTVKSASPVAVPSLQSEKQIEDEISLPHLKKSLSSSQMCNGGASELVKHQKDAFLTRGSDCAIDLYDTSLFACDVTTNKIIHCGDYLDYNVDDYILNELCTEDSNCKQVDYFSDSKWQCGPFRMKDQMDKLTWSSPCADFHEVTDSADANQVFGRPSQLSLKGMSLKDGWPSFSHEMGIEFSNAELNMQRRSLDVVENVDVGSRRKKSRTVKWASPVAVPFLQSEKQIEDRISLSALRKSLSASQVCNGGASELIKHQKDAFLTRGSDCAVDLYNTSLFAREVTTNNMISCGEPVSDNLYSNVDNCILNELSTEDSNCKQVDYFSDSKRRSGTLLMKDQMEKLTWSSPCDDFHEVTDSADANQVFGKPSQLRALKEMSLKDSWLSCPHEMRIEFSNAELNMQKRSLDVGENVDVGNQDDIDLISEESEPSHNFAKPLWLSKCTNQHDKMLKSKSLSHDIRPSIMATEWSDEENFFASHSLKHSKKYGINRPSSSSEWSSRIPNCLVGEIPDNDDFIGGDIHFKHGKATEDNYQDREEKYCNFNRDTAVNGLDVANSAELFSDCKCNSGLQGDFSEFSEFSGDKLGDSCLTNFSDIFSDEVYWSCTNMSGKSSLLNSSDSLTYKSVHNQLDRNKFGRIQIENRETQCEKREARRSISAPPFYKRRRKFFHLNNLFEKVAGQTDSDDTALAGFETSNAKHYLQAFDECHFPPKESCVADSLCIPRLENEGFQNKDFMSNEIQDGSEYDLKWRRSCQQAMGVMKLQNAGIDDILDVSSGVLQFACDSLVPTSINKTCLRDAKVLQQVDKKFIPVVAGNILAIIDQHAADERIRLEELRQKVLSGEMKQVTYLEAEKELVLPEIGYQLLHNYVEQAQNWGWICNIYGPSSSSFAKKMNVLHRQQTVAKLVAVPCILGVNLTDTDLLEFLQQLADTDGSSTIPPSVLRILNNKACRGAIMFGDTLLPSECSLIVEELKQTSLCFQCAHGRPTTVPLVNLEVLHKQIDKLAVCRNGTQELWHGLGRHEISLERAAYRLSSAMK